MRAQRRAADGSWETVTGDFTAGDAPFSWRWYGLFGFLADVRNYSSVPPISQPRGLPDDWPEQPDDHGDWTEWYDRYEVGEHSFTWLTVAELAAYDYDQTFEDLRRNGSLVHHEPGAGVVVKLRDFLGEGFFRDLKLLQDLGCERLVFGFDS